MRCAGGEGGVLPWSGRRAVSRAVRVAQRAGSSGAAFSASGTSVERSRDGSALPGSTARRPGRGGPDGAAPGTERGCARTSAPGTEGRETCGRISRRRRRRRRRRGPPCARQGGARGRDGRARGRDDVAWPREGAGASGAVGGRCSGGSTAVRAAAAPNPRRLRLAAAVPGPACRGRAGGCGPATASGLCSRSHVGRAWPPPCLAPACREGERPRRRAQSRHAHRCRARPPRRTAAPCSAARPLPHLARAPQHRRTRPPPERIVGRG